MPSGGTLVEVRAVSSTERRDERARSCTRTPARQPEQSREPVTCIAARSARTFAAPRLLTDLLADDLLDDPAAAAFGQDERLLDVERLAVRQAVGAGDHHARLFALELDGAHGDVDVVGGGAAQRVL